MLPVLSTNFFVSENERVNEVVSATQITKHQEIQKKMSALRESEQVDTPENAEVPSKQKPDLNKIFEILSNEVCGMPETFSIIKS